MEDGKGISVAGFIIFILVVCVGVAGPSSGADKTYWQGGVGSWFEPGNWTAGIPTANVDAYVKSTTDVARVQIEGGSAEVRELYLGGISGTDAAGAVTPSVYLGPGGRLEAERESIGYLSRVGVFVQEGGSNIVDRTLYIAADYGHSYGVGSVYHMGAGELTTGNLTIGSYSAGRFFQEGGQVVVRDRLRLQSYAGQSIYQMRRGELTTGLTNLYASRGRTLFSQEGGTHVAQEGLCVCGEHVPATYELAGGSLQAAEELIGQSYWPPSITGTGNFVHRHGTNTTNYLSVNELSTYVLSDASLEITGGGLDIQGLLDCRGEPSTINVASDSIVNLSGAEILAGKNVSLSVGPNTLTIYSPGAHPKDIFAEFSTQGRLHEAGQTLIVQPGERLAGRGRIDDYVVCAGQIVGTGESYAYAEGASI